MEYKYKSYNPNEWKFYQSYLNLQKLPKFSGLRPTAVVESSVDTESDELRSGGRGGESSNCREIEVVKRE